MSVRTELAPFSEAELQAGRLAFLFRKAGLKGLMCDLDGTFIDTKKWFEDFIIECAQLIHQENGQKIESLATLIREASAAAFATYFVNPNRWQFVIPQIVTRSDLQAECLNTLAGIYQGSPALKPGAQEALGVLRFLPKYGLRTAIITHANDDWTKIKARELKLDRVFPEIKTISEDGPKGPDQWRAEINSLGLEPEEVAIVGDSLRSDIIPASQINTGLIGWLDDETNWDFYRQGQAPEQAFVFHQIKDLVPVLTQALTPQP